MTAGIQRTISRLNGLWWNLLQRTHSRSATMNTCMAADLRILWILRNKFRYKSFRSCFA